MKSYEVFIPLHGYITGFVQANDDEEAIDKFRESIEWNFKVRVYEHELGTEYLDFDDYGVYAKETE